MKILQQVLDEISKQLQRVQTEVMDVLKSFVKDVVGGVWTGPDADRFVDDLNNKALKGLSDIVTSVTALHTGIGQAADTVIKADASASQKVADLVNTFSKIY